MGETVKKRWVYDAKTKEPKLVPVDEVKALLKSGKWAQHPFGGKG